MAKVGDLIRIDYMAGEENYWDVKVQLLVLMMLVSFMALGVVLR